MWSMPCNSHSEHSSDGYYFNWSNMHLWGLVLFSKDAELYFLNQGSIICEAEMICSCKVTRQADKLFDEAGRALRYFSSQSWDISCLVLSSFS